VSAPVPRLYLLDASIYVFRAWHVLPDTLVDAEGEPANAVIGFGDFLVRFLERAAPERAAVAFDESLETSVRNEIYPAYKANRPPAPESLRRQFGLCRVLAEAAGLAVFASNRFEADDLLGTLATTMRRHGLRSTVVTGDKDLAQLVRTGDEWWDFARDTRLDTEGIVARFGVAPHQLPDLLALAGDRIDNIPGVPGVGMATAARLLRRWDDLDGVYANLEGVRHMRFRGAARVAALLAEHEPSARLSRRLTAVLDADGLPSAPAALDRQAPDRDALATLIRRLDVGATRGERWLAGLGGPGGG
jgi:5'-3' exonuclease